MVPRRSLRGDVKGAAALDVPEGGAVKVHHQSLPAALVGSEGELDAEAAFGEQIRKSVGDAETEESVWFRSEVVRGHVTPENGFSHSINKQ